MAEVKTQHFPKNQYFNLLSTSELGYSRLGYDFYRWQVVSNDLCSETQLSDGQQLCSDEEDIYLSGLWTPIQYRIDYELDGGTNSPYNPKEYTITSETSVLYSATKDDYDFVKWVDPEGNTVTKIAKGSYGNKTLSAIWEESVVDLTYDTGWRGGEILSASYATNWLSNSIRVGRVQTGNTYLEPKDIIVSKSGLIMPTSLSQYIKDQDSRYRYIDDYNGIISAVGKPNSTVANHGGGYVGYDWLNLPGVTCIYGCAFCEYAESKRKIKHLRIPNVKTITPQLAYYPLINLSSIYIPRTNRAYSVQDISGNVVDDGIILRQSSNNMIIWGSPASCRGRVQIPQAKIIQYRAFAGCSSMTRIDIPYAETIHGGSFADCIGLSTIVLTSVSKQTTLTADTPFGSTESEDPFMNVTVSNISVYVPDTLVSSFTTWKTKGFKVLSAQQLVD